MGFSAIHTMLLLQASFTPLGMETCGNISLHGQSCIASCCFCCKFFKEVHYYACVDAVSAWTSIAGGSSADARQVLHLAVNRPRPLVAQPRALRGSKECWSMAPRKTCQSESCRKSCAISVLSFCQDTARPAISSP